MSQEQMITHKIETFKHHIKVAHQRGDKLAVSNFNKRIRQLKQDLKKVQRKHVRAPGV